MENQYTLMSALHKEEEQMKKLISILVALLVVVSFFGFNAKTAYAATKIETVNVSISRTVDAFPGITVSATGLTVGSPTWSCTLSQLKNMSAGSRITATFPITVKSGYYLAAPVKYKVTGTGATNYSIRMSVKNGKGTLSVTVPIYKQLFMSKITWKTSSLPTWQKVSGASSYTIIVCDVSTGNKVASKTTTGTSVNLDKMVSPGTYIVKIRANSGNSYILPSNYVQSWIIIAKVYAVPKG